MSKKKIWFFKYDIWQDNVVYLPQIWYGFKRYYELNGTHADEWEWIPPIVDYHDWSIDDIVNEAVSHNANVYMFSSYMWNWEIVKVVAHGIKLELPNATIVIGGPHQHTTYTQPMFWFKDHPYVDATARPSEYGEYFITDMLDLLAVDALDWNNVRGSYHRRGMGQEGVKKEFKYPPDVIRSNISHAKQVSEYAHNKDKLLGIMYETNRGCMYKCVYCEWGGGTNTKVVIKDIEGIYDDVSFFKELDIHTVWITDANFGILKRDPEIAELFASQDSYLKFVGINGLAKTDSKKRAAVLEPLIKAGLVKLYQISLQTIDEKILENISRTDVPVKDNIELAKRLIAQYDIDVMVELILGMPGMKVDTFYKETAIEFSLLNSVKHQTHHVPLYVLPDAPVANPEYLEKYNIKLAPIAIEESVELISNTQSKYVKSYNSMSYRQEHTLHIPISSYSYTVEDWKEMFFMNDMNHVLMNTVLVSPFINFLHYHKQIDIDVIFKKIFNSLSNVSKFYDPIYSDYLTPLANGEYWNKSWRQFEAGPVTGPWSIQSSYLWLWCSNIEEVYESIRTEFSDCIDDAVSDCLIYCKNSTLGVSQDITWENSWRWDNWEESATPNVFPEHSTIKLVTKYQEIDWLDRSTLYRNRATFRYHTQEPIKMKMLQLTRD